MNVPMCVALATLIWPAGERGEVALDAARPAPPPSNGLQPPVEVDWDGDGRPDLLRLDERGALTVERGADGNAARALPGERATRVDLGGEASGGVREVTLISRNGGADVDLLVIDDAGRARLWHRSADGGVRPGLDLGSLGGRDGSNAGGSGGASAGRADSTRDSWPTGPSLDVFRGARGPGAPTGGAATTGSGSEDPTTLGPAGSDSALALRDSAVPGGSIQASTIPTLGQLYPMTSDLFVSSTGRVGIHDTNPTERLTVNGSAIVDGPLSVGLGANERVRVAQGADGRQTLQLKNGIGQPTVALGEHINAPGTRVGLEMLDTLTDAPYVTDSVAAGAPDGIALSDRETGSTGLEVTSQAILARNAAGLATLLLAGDLGGYPVQLANSAGQATTSLFVETPPAQGATFEMKQTSATPPVEFGWSATNAGTLGEAHLRVGPGVEFETRRAGGIADSGSLELNNDGGFARVSLQSVTTSGGPLVAVRSDVEDRVRIVGSGNGGGPAIEVVEPGDAPIVKIEGSGSASGQSGTLTMLDEAGKVITRLDGDVDKGGRFQAYNEAGIAVVTVDASKHLVQLCYPDGTPSAEIQSGWIRLFDTDGNLKIWFDGDTGTKNGVFDTTDFGRRAIYAVESPEVWFEDAGRGRLEAGAARVELDPIFLETVVIDAEHPLVVFATPTGACKGLWVESDATGFVVHERDGGTSRAAFDWRVLAHRKGLQNVRLARPPHALEANRTGDVEMQGKDGE